MTFNPSIRTPRGYGRQPVKNFQEISAGIRPHFHDMYPAKYLPVKSLVERVDEYYVIEAGVIVALDAAGRIVPCNGGAAQNIVYTANDVAYTVDIEDSTDFVSTAKTVSAGFAANMPIGWANEHFMSYTHPERHVNYKHQDYMPVLADYLVEVPLRWNAQTTGGNAIVQGCLVKARGAAVDNTSECGAPIRWINGDDSVEQIAGRVTWLGEIRERGALSKVRTVPGTGVAGDQTNGIESWLAVKHQATNQQATHCVRISTIML